MRKLLPSQLVERANHCVELCAWLSAIVILGHKGIVPLNLSNPCVPKLWFLTAFSPLPHTLKRSILETTYGTAPHADPTNLDNIWRLKRPGNADTLQPWGDFLRRLRMERACHVLRHI